MNRAKPENIARDERVASLLKIGKRPKEIRTELGVTSKVVCRVRVKLGMPAFQKNTGHFWPSTTRRRAEAIVMHKEGFSFTEIAKKFGVSRNRAAQIVHKERHYARIALQKAIRAGDIIRGKRCNRCGQESEHIDGHHHDYRRPFAVEWLCRECHLKLRDPVPVCEQVGNTM